MVASESAKLRILPGNIYLEERALVYEVDGTLQRVILPFESQEVIELLIEKDRSVAEIVTELKSRNNGRVSFKNLFFTTQKLMSEGVVYQASQETPPYFDDSKVQLANGLTVDLVVSKKAVLTHLIRMPLFYLVSFAVILAGTYYSWELIEEGTHTEFLWIKGRYDFGFVFALIFASAMFTIKSLLQLILNLTSLGRVYDVSFRITPLSCTLHLDDTTLYGTARKSTAVIYGLASMTIYMCMAGISKHYFFGELASPHVLTLGLLLTLFDLNPLGRGELRKFAAALIPREEDDHLRPFYETRVFRSILRMMRMPKKDRGFLIFSEITIAWSVISMGVLLYIANGNAPILATEIVSDDMAQRTSAGIVLVSLIVPFIYICADFLNVLFKNVSGLNYGLSAYIKNKYGSKELKLLNRERLKELIASTPLFSSVDGNILEYIMDNGTVVSYKPGTPIIQQGTKGSEIYLILLGSVQVRRREDSGLERKLTTLPAGSVFGEMSVYGMNERTADVVALEKVEAFVFRAEALLDLSRAADYQVQMQFVMDRIMVTQYFLSQPFFAALPVELIQVFYNHGVVEDYESNKVIVEQGKAGEDFFLILRGSAFVEVNGHSINTLNQGEFFGEIALLNDTKRTATIRTAQAATLLRVPSHVFWQLALSNLDLATYFESIAEKRLQELQAPLQQAVSEALSSAQKSEEPQTQTDITDVGEPAEAVETVESVAPVASIEAVMPVETAAVETPQIIEPPKVVATPTPPPPPPPKASPLKPISEVLAVAPQMPTTPELPVVDEEPSFVVEEPTAVPPTAPAAEANAEVTYMIDLPEDAEVTETSEVTEAPKKTDDSGEPAA